VFSVVEDRLKSDDFYVHAHKVLFAAMERMAAQARAIDLTTLLSWLRDRDQVEEAGGVEYLSQVVGCMPTTAHVDHYARRVEELALVRRLIATGTGIVKSAYEPFDDATHLLDTAEQAIMNLSRHTGRGGLVPLHEVLVASYAQIEELQEDPMGLRGTPTGFIDLDQMVSGLKVSDLLVLAARPSMGKTALALNVAQNVAVRSGKTVAIFTLEMSAPQLALRMLSAEGTIDAGVFRTGKLTDEDWVKLAMAIGVLSEAPVFIDDTPGMTVFDIRAKLRRLQAKRGVDLVIIDYLQLITGRGGDNRQQEISEISRSLKLMAREFNVPVMALSQLSRAVEQRQNKHPMLSDLRESGSIEQDADIVAFLYREDYYDPDTERKNIVEIIIGKQRNGPTGIIELLFLKKYNKFLSLETSHS
jgi:replicative DNA helicase